jgi:hypothetical protein
VKIALNCALGAMALFALSVPSFALNPQPEPPGVNHDPNVSIQHSNPTLTTQVSANCGAASGAPNVVAGGTQSAISMNARVAPAAGGGLPGNGIAQNVDKCAKGASGMTAATATPAPAATTPAH